jgi:hypothetical protein
MTNLLINKKRKSEKVSKRQNFGCFVEKDKRIPQKSLLLSGSEATYCIMNCLRLLGTTLLQIFLNGRTHVLVAEA